MTSLQMAWFLITFIFVYGVIQLAFIFGSTTLAHIKEFHGKFSLIVLAATFYIAMTVGAVYSTMPFFNLFIKAPEFDQARLSAFFLEWFYVTGVAFGLYFLLRGRIEKLWTFHRRHAIPHHITITPVPFLSPCLAEGELQSGESPSDDNGVTRKRLLPQSTFLSDLPFNQVYQLEVVEKQIILSSLPQAWNGLKIAHLTDFHFLPAMDQDYYQHCLDLTMDWKPDLIVLTGDFVSKEEYIGFGMKWLSRLSAPMGVYAVRGNHDFWAEPDKISDYLALLNIHLLDNKSQSFQRQGSVIYLVGIEHPWLPLRNGKFVFPETNGHCKILLSHSPDNFIWAVKHNYALVLSGHTHGGQITLPVVGPLLVPSRYGKRYARGLFKKKNTYLYVSRGLGCSVPLRINCAPEISFFTLLSGMNTKQEKKPEQEIIHN